MKTQLSISRRNAVSRLAGLALGTAAMAAASPILGFDFSGVSIPDDLRVETDVEIEGELRVGEDPTKPIRLPLEAKAKLAYFLRKLSPTSDAELGRSVREYETAEASIKLRGKASESRLSEERRVVLSRTTPSSWIVTSPLGPISREEMELLQTGGNVEAIRGLLPDVKKGEKEAWNAPSEALQRLLGLEEITENTVKFHLASDGTKGVLTADGEGKIAANTQGVKTTFELKLKISLDAATSSMRWFTAALRETREIGNAQPGCETVTKIKTVFRPATVPPTLSDEALESLSLDNNAAEQMLKISPTRSQYSVLADSRWYMVLDRPELTVLRMVDGNLILGQCNITILPAARADKPVTADNFAAEVRRSLGQNFKEEVENDSFETSGGLNVIKVKALGSANDLTIQWTYYHLTDAEGRRASVAFTCNSEKIVQFAEADRNLIESFTFGDGTGGPSEALAPASVLKR
jgi:hypothetical protein